MPVLGNVATLRGHKGCVNRLAWSFDGSKLASVSDDTDLLIWGGRTDYPVGAQPVGKPDGNAFSLNILTRIDTGHSANVFGVAFLPGSSDRVLITGGMDGQIRLHCVDRVRQCTGASPMGPTGRSPGMGPTSPGLSPLLAGSLGSAGAPTSTRSPRIARLEARFGTRAPPSGAWLSELRYTHRGRVKAVAVAPDCPHLFWSASEDATVCQFDVREPIDQERPVLISGAFASPNPLRGMGTARRTFSMKHVAVNPVRPNLLAVACGDSYLRVYDRRMMPALGPVLGAVGASGLLPRTWSHRSAAAANANVLRYAPLHLSGEYPSPWLLPPDTLACAPADFRTCLPAGDRRADSAHATHCDWDPAGHFLMGTWHGDGVYVFDVRGAELPPTGPVQSFGLGCEHTSAPYVSFNVSRQVTFRESEGTTQDKGMSDGAVQAMGESRHQYAFHDSPAHMICSQANGFPEDQQAVFDVTMSLPASHVRQDWTGAMQLTATASSALPQACAQVLVLPPGSLRSMYRTGNSAHPEACFSTTAWQGKEEGNSLFRQSKFGEAIALYSAAIEVATDEVHFPHRRIRMHEPIGPVADCPASTSGSDVADPAPGARPVPVLGVHATHSNGSGLAQLLTNRASAYLKRNVVGDASCAVADCVSALSLTPHAFKPQLRLVQALHSAKRFRTALAHAKALMHNWSLTEGQEGEHDEHNVGWNTEAVLDIDRGLVLAHDIMRQSILTIGRSSGSGERYDLTGNAIDISGCFSFSRAPPVLDTRGEQQTGRATEPTPTPSGSGLLPAQAVGTEEVSRADIDTTMPDLVLSASSENEEDEVEVDVEVEEEAKEEEKDDVMPIPCSTRHSENPIDTQQQEIYRTLRVCAPSWLYNIPGIPPPPPPSPHIFVARKESAVQKLYQPAGCNIPILTGIGARQTAPMADVYEPDLLCTRHTGRYTSHSNLQTDIKESCFWGGPGWGGPMGAGCAEDIDRAMHAGWRGKDAIDASSWEGMDGEGMDVGDAHRLLARRARRHGGKGYVLAGSDDGRLWVYDRASGLPLEAVGGDEDVVNAVRPHPTLPLVATSGIENVIRMWAPHALGAGAPHPDPAREWAAPTVAPPAEAEVDSRRSRRIGTSPALGAAIAPIGDPRDERPAMLMRADLRDPTSLVAAAETAMRGAGGRGGLDLPEAFMLRLLTGLGAVPGDADGALAGTGAQNEGDDEDEDEDGAHEGGRHVIHCPAQ